MSVETKQQAVVSLNPVLWFDGDCKKALTFYEKALPCKVSFEMACEDTIIHACIDFGDSKIYANDVHSDNPEGGPKANCSATMYVNVKNCDSAMKTAVEAGCTQLIAPNDFFWGARMGKVIDPFGHTWCFSHHFKTPTEEDLTKGRDEWWAKAKRKRKVFMTDKASKMDRSSKLPKSSKDEEEKASKIAKTDQSS
mmetsp:Transcript_9936/g.13708  ORF Transcript_9936/g.13708 Transcript_9936/m.13708 type:complete len:195 (-) Transcript_9936:291-875(-)